MTNYVHIQTLEYPLNLKQISARENISFGKFVDIDYLNQLGYAEVTPTPRPTGVNVRSLGVVEVDAATYSYAENWVTDEYSPQQLHDIAVQAAKQTLEANLAAGHPQTLQSGQQINVPIRLEIWPIMATILETAKVKSPGETVMLRTTDNVNVDIPAEEFPQVFDNAFTYQQNVYGDYWAVKDTPVE